MKVHLTSVAVAALLVVGCGGGDDCGALECERGAMQDSSACACVPAFDYEIACDHDGTDVICYGAAWQTYDDLNDGSTRVECLWRDVAYADLRDVCVWAEFVAKPYECYALSRETVHPGGACAD